VEPSAVPCPIEIEQVLVSPVLVQWLRISKPGLSPQRFLSSRVSPDELGECDIHNVLVQVGDWYGGGDVVLRIGRVSDDDRSADVRRVGSHLDEAVAMEHVCHVHWVVAPTHRGSPPKDLVLFPFPRNLHPVDVALLQIDRVPSIGVSRGVTKVVIAGDANIKETLRFRWTKNGVEGFDGSEVCEEVTLKLVSVGVIAKVDVVRSLAEDEIGSFRVLRVEVIDALLAEGIAERGEHSSCGRVWVACASPFLPGVFITFPVNPCGQARRFGEVRVFEVFPGNNDTVLGEAVDGELQVGQLVWSQKHSSGPGACVPCAEIWQAFA